MSLSGYGPFLDPAWWIAHAYFDGYDLLWPVAIVTGRVK